ncbi:hypothetical protein T484DRAFT_1968027 [Baffinella frigidus]|nr:hypothetical protein T484DRAFT_1968027 [Cryptophyta sp. CCMP2293]
MSAAPKLIYFGFRGRALASRVALFNALGKDGWVDERVSLPRFKKEAKQEQNPERLDAPYITNNLPQLNLPCGTKFSQSHAIARYAARLPPAPEAAAASHHTPDLYPSGKSSLIVDEAIAVVDQILLLTPKDSDEATRQAAREAYQRSGFLRVGMELLEGRLKQSSGPFLLGSQLSIADLYVRAPLCDLFELKHFDGVTDDFVAQFPRVQECGLAVLEHPLLKAYHENYKN